MKCKNCGSEIGEGKKFCRMCGVRIEDTYEKLQSSEDFAESEAKNSNLDDKSNLDSEAKNSDNSKRNKMIALTIVVVIVALLGIVIYLGTRNSSNEIASNESDKDVVESTENLEVTETDTTQRVEEQKEEVIEDQAEELKEDEDEQIEASEDNNSNEQAAGELNEEYKELLGNFKRWMFYQEGIEPVCAKEEDSLYLEALEEANEEYWNQILSRKIPLPSGRYNIRIEYFVISESVKWQIPIYIQQSSGDYLPAWRSYLRNDDRRDSFLNCKVFEASFEVKQDWEDMRVAMNLGKLQGTKFYLYKVKLTCEELYAN